jgi:hypothetical protein
MRWELDKAKKFENMPHDKIYELQIALEGSDTVRKKFS